MIVIGHRGAAGLAPENTVKALQTGLDAGAEMLELDVRLTRDHVPIIAHDRQTVHVHRYPNLVSQRSAAELKADPKGPTVATLDQVLKKFGGKVMLNIQLKSRGSAKPVIDVLRNFAKKQPGIWDTTLITSFFGRELIAARKFEPRINLGLIHRKNPFLFLTYQRRLDLTAVGFHRLYINPFALEIARRVGLFTYCYTVNRPKTALIMYEKGLDGIVTDYPDIMVDALPNQTRL